MLFNSVNFALFFAVVWALYRSLPARSRNGLLLGASLLFYGLWVPAYLVLLFAEILVNYALLRAVARSARPRVALVASIVFTLGLLAGFKYAALAVETAAPILRTGFGFDPPLPDIFLPLGISFFSFQIIGLAIDTYRGDMEPPESLSRYALFVSFFPQLIAGPILRGRQLLPQLARGGAAQRPAISAGCG
jgi:alginate O-acetyltransferase complex protein AlgI